jgi:ligand-binding sensor domain-containing protein
MWMFSKDAGRTVYATVAVTLVTLAGQGACQPPVPSQAGSPVATLIGAQHFTPTNTVRQIAQTPNGDIWAATSGGIVRWKKTGRIFEPGRVWTTANGLFSSDVRAFAVANKQIVAALPTRVDTVEEGRILPFWMQGVGEVRSVAIKKDSAYIATSDGVYHRSLNGASSKIPGAGVNAWRFAYENGTLWVITATEIVALQNGRTVGAAPLPDGAQKQTVTGFVGVPSGGFLVATALGLWARTGDTWRMVELPKTSRGAYVSALHVGESGKVWAGVYGDGIYELRQRPNGWQWTQFAVSPDVARVTALLSDKNRVFAGTQESGVLVLSAQTGKIAQYLTNPDALPSGDIYALTTWQGETWAATFDRGVMRLSDKGFVSENEGMSSPYPRQFAVWHGALYVRHTTGQVDAWNPVQRKWEAAWPARTLSRPQVFCIAREPNHLLVGGWAGWAINDGQNWEQHWNDSEFAGQVITAIAQGADGSVWIGTQKRGLFRYRNGTYTHFHEAHGLSDDWITTINVQNGRVLVGTYTGGLLQKDGDRFNQVLDTNGFAVRSVVVGPDDKATVATPLGVYRDSPTGFALLPPTKTGGLEAQALHQTPSGLWVGTRTGIAFIPE